MRLSVPLAAFAPDCIAPDCSTPDCSTPDCLARVCLQASALRCMSDRICVPGPCDVPISAGTAWRMTDLNSVAPAIRSDNETSAMAKTIEDRNPAQGRKGNAAGEPADLQLAPDRTRFALFIGGRFAHSAGQDLRYRAFGACEVQ